MELVCKGRNLYIVNKTPAEFETIEFEETKICLQGKHTILVNEIYACLYCEELKNIIFIVKDDSPHNVTLIFGEMEEFTKILKHLQVNYSGIEFSQQDKKINGYAAAITGKLQEGIETGIVDKPVQQEVKCCPVCGMECDPSIPYCMECGAEV